MRSRLDPYALGGDWDTVRRLLAVLVGRCEDGEAVIARSELLAVDARTEVRITTDLPTGHFILTVHTPPPPARFIVYPSGYVVDKAQDLLRGQH